MQLRKCVVDVSLQRRLLALIATQAPCAATSGTRFDEVLVYLHGFPDMAAHPTKLDFASRMPFKLAEAWLSAASTTSGGSNSATKSDESQRGVAFVTFNFGGAPGFDDELRFTDKTISKEVEDDSWLRSRIRAHVVGLSTGAVIASLLHAKKGVADTIAVVAGLSDLTRRVGYNFSPLWLTQFEKDGACWTECYLSDRTSSPKGVDISLDRELKTDIKNDHGGEGEGESGRTVPGEIFIQLNKEYIDECRDENVLDIESAVSSSFPSLSAEEDCIHL